MAVMAEPNFPTISARSWRLPWEKAQKLRENRFVFFTGDANTIQKKKEKFSVNWEVGAGCVGMEKNRKV